MNGRYDGFKRVFVILVGQLLVATGFGFRDHFLKSINSYIRVGYNLDIMRQSACLSLNLSTGYSYGFLFNCTTVGRASDSMTALM